MVMLGLPSKMEDQKQNSLPVLPWMRNPVNLSLIEECPFELLPGLDPRLQNALQKMGFTSLFPIQFAVWLETIGPGAFDRDLCINSPTGSGKTLAYALPIVQMLSARVVRCLRALVVVPTRDLALQVKEVFAAIAPAVGLSVGLAIGQTSIANEVSELMKTPKLEAGICYDPDDHVVGFQSSVDILVATPGRLMDHINTTEGFTLEHLRFLVVDETDRLLRESYQSWLPTVLQLTQTDEQDIFPHSAFGSLKTIRKSGVERGFKGKTSPRLVKMVLSATLTRDPSKLSQLDLHHPLFLTTPRYMLPEKLESYKLICESKDKALYLVALLQELKGEKCIVFTSSTQSTDRLYSFLKFFGGLPFKFKKYSGLLHQFERNKTIVAFRKGKVQILIASDAMTRGMDIKGVSTVVNYDMPAYTKTYVHRAGRTARAMEGGRCFTLLQSHEEKRFNKLLDKADHNASVYTLHADSIEAFRPQYTLAVEKLNGYLKSGTIKTRQGKV